MDAYIRVSRVGGREGPGFISPDVQRETILRWTQANGVDIAAEHVDLDQSGGTMERPGFTEALRRVEAGETGGIIVAKANRFGRSLVGSLEAIARVEAAGGEFVAVEDGMDTSTPIGKLMQRLVLSLAEFELDRIREQWQIARQRALARGVHFRTPLGYRKRPDGTLEPDDMAAAVRDLFRLRGDGWGWQEIADHLNDRHPRDVEWLASVLPRLVRNRAYLGEAFSGDMRRTDAHEPLVTRQVWEKAQTARVSRPTRGDTALLAGLIRCAGCRYLMTPATGGRKTPVYRCQVRYGAGRCGNPATVVRHLVDDHVQREFLLRYGDIPIGAFESSAALDEARERLQAAEQELDDLASDLGLRKAFGHDRFRQVVADAAGEADAAREALEDAKRTAVGLSMPDESIWQELTTAERRSVLMEGIDTVFLRRTGIAAIDSRVKILWPGEAPDDLPGRGAARARSLVPFEW